MFRGMEYVHAVYQEKSISRAAERLCISQPSLSANIKRIEGKVGYPLFDRSTKPLSLTECGEKYIQSIEKIMAVENEFADYVNDWGDLKTGSLVLGGSSLFASWVLPGLIGRFSARYPKVHVELVEESTAELARLLQQGRIDMMLDNCKLDPKLFDHAVYREETLFLAVPYKFPAIREASPYIGLPGNDRDRRLEGRVREARPLGTLCPGALRHAEARKRYPQASRRNPPDCRHHA